MKCDRVLELISARIDRENIFDNDALDDHLRACPACCDEQEGMRRLDEFLWRAFAPERDEAEALVSKVKATLHARGRSVRRCTVLVVDDESVILNLVQRILIKEGEEFDVVVAGSVREAQEWFGRREIDIVLTDLRLTEYYNPGTGGIELLEWALEHRPRTQRLIMTTFQELEEAVDAINRGQVLRYLPKPFTSEALLNSLRSAARLLQLERDHQRVLRELSELNVQLEERVRQRTRELEEAVGELEQRTQTLEKFALTDALTLLPNRRALDHLMERELYLCRRFPAPLTVGFIDVDFFKEINSKFLHPAGDYVLRELAKCLTAGLRKIDVLGRSGGDEFMLIAPQTHRAGGLVLAERLRARVERHSFLYQGQEVPVTISIGLAVVEAGRPADYEQVKMVAAVALKRAKDNGRSCVEIEPVAPAPPADDATPGPGGIVSA
jgi:diguanylate cyclase (GGDEF)-like protein